MPTLTEGMHRDEFIGEFAMGLDYHSDEETVAETENLASGHVVGKITIGAKTAVGAADIPAPAAATITAAPAATAAAKAGVHRFVCVVGGATTTSKWRHIDPDGEIVGYATGDTEYVGGGLTLTITDAGTDPVAGETFKVTVSEAAASEEIVEYDPTNTDGSGSVYGVLREAVDASDGALPGVVITRGPGKINVNDLTWFSGANANQKAAAVAELLALGIKAV